MTYRELKVGDLVKLRECNTLLLIVKGEHMIWNYAEGVTSNNETVTCTNDQECYYTNKIH